MMKKILRTILRAIPVVLVLVFCLSVTAMAYSGSESVTLKTTQNEATSGSLSCHHAKVSATNSASSQHNVSAALQLSSGSGWNIRYCIIEPANKLWERPSTAGDNMDINPLHCS